MRQRVEQPGSGRRGQRLGVAAVRLLRRHRRGEARLWGDREPPDVVHGAEPVIPRVGVEQRAHLVLAARHVVDLEPELDRQPALLRRGDRLHVRLDRIHAALELVRHPPQRAGLAEVVDVLGEPDLVDALGGRRLAPALDGVDGVRDRARVVAEVHVVVDDHPASQLSTRTRSSGPVTFSSRGSPGTVQTRPPAASTIEAQSGKLCGSEPLSSAALSTGATKACGVCTAASSSRGSVSTTAVPRTRLIVSVTGSTGTTPSQPSESGNSTRSRTSSETSGRAASWTTITAASSPTSATPALTESARL